MTVAKLSRIALLAAVAALAVSATTIRAEDVAREDLLQQVRELRAKVEQLEAAQRRQDERLTKEEVDATVREVLSDADRRSQLLAQRGFTAGYDNGFVIRSEDGNFVLRPAIWSQFRYVGNYSDDDANEHDDGFEVRRLRLRFSGNAFSPNFSYVFQWDTNRTGGDLQLIDAYTQYVFRPGWAVKLGQFKESVFHERDVSEIDLLVIDRTLADALLGGQNTDRVQGVALVHGGGKDDAVRAELAYHDGANSKNTNFQDTTSDFGVGARFEYKLFGDWAAYRDFTAKTTKKDLLVFGAGADFTQADAADILRSTFDAHFETARGLSVYGAIHVNYNNPDDDIADAESGTDFGALIQVGYLITKKIELYGRYDVVAFDDSPISEDVFNEFTLGGNYYLGLDGNYINRAKLSLDVVYLPDGSPSEQTGIGVIAGDEQQFILRGQFQLIL